MSSEVAGLELSHDVLYGIAQLALDDVEGVRTITPPTRVGEFLTGRRAKGIAIERHDERVTIALTVAMTYGERIPEVARAAQRAVREAVGSMTGLTVDSVEVFVEGIDVPVPAPGAPGATPRAAHTGGGGLHAEDPPAGRGRKDDGRNPPRG